MRRKWILGILYMVIVGMLAACGEDTLGESSSQEETQIGKNNESSNASSSDVDLSGENILISTGSESGTVYPIGVQIGEYLQGMGATATNTTGNAIANLELMEVNEVDIGHSSSFLGFAAEKGLEPFEGRKFENIRAVAKLMDNTFQFAVLEKNGIDSLDQVANEQYPIKIGVSQPGSEAELTTRRVLEAHGITYDDIESWGGRVEYGSHGDLSSLLRDGHIEAIAIVSSVPAAAITEIDLQNSMKVLSLSDEVANGLKDNFGYDIADVPSEAYNGQSVVAKTVVGGLVFFAHKDLSNEAVYQITKFINEDGKGRISSIHHQLENFLNSHSTAEGLGATLHPGAEQYYKDTGLID